ncbi:hypothetical protein WICPIJ_007932 [Wickerhamomyces pijperi]|uniref:Uncharacterized protein n=1 Tax=Wickerhamomyces pijperi TaxID=599730 RepID=A0A9P8Q0R1_WICPI|nr:hypothetical protein WICPIJ_007932 [Wickerhamomyces pijperi]
MLSVPNPPKFLKTGASSINSLTLVRSSLLTLPFFARSNCSNTVACRSCKESWKDFREIVRFSFLDDDVVVVGADETEDLFLVSFIS